MLGKLSEYFWLFHDRFTLFAKTKMVSVNINLSELDFQNAKFSINGTKTNIYTNV